MPYLIDGHNLIGQLPDISLDDPHDEAKLVERLKSFMGRHRKRCTVVFDGGLPGGFSRDLSTHSVQAVFAHGGTSADAIIMERIQAARDPGSLVVISADHEIIDAARRRRITVLAPTEFAQQLQAPGKPQAPARDGSEANPRLSAAEVNDWLRLFGAESEDD